MQAARAKVVQRWWRCPLVAFSALDDRRRRRANVRGAVAEAKPAKRIEGSIATVNEVAIDAKAFYAELDKITSRGAKIPPERLARIEQNILKRLVEKELVRQAVEKAGIKVEDAEIAAAYEEYKKRFQTEEQFQNYLKHGRVTEASIRERITDKRSLEKLIESRGNLAVDDKQGREFYAKNERFYVDKAGVRASHILIKLNEKATPEQTKAAMEKVKKVQSELEAKKAYFDCLPRPAKKTAKKTTKKSTKK